MMNHFSITDDNVEERDLVAFISINDTGKDSYFKRNHKNVLTLHFDDVDKDGETSPTNYGDTKAFSEDQANEIIEFIKKNSGAEDFIVHCHAGISRSGAVGRFINDYLGGDKELFERMNPRIVPNGRVLELLNKFFH